MEKIVVATDSFKGSLSSRDAGMAVSAGVSRALPGSQVQVIAVGDGGEGTVEALTEALGASPVSCRAHGPLMEICEVPYAVSADGGTAVLEIAAAAGLTMVPPGRRNPLYTSTYGVGEAIADALRRGVRRFLIGLGGSSTNDAGAGMLSALGYRFYDASGCAVRALCGQDLSGIARIDPAHSAPELAETQFIVACDVDNPLYGPRGAAYVFGPQKGASYSDVAALDLGLRQFSEAMVASGYDEVCDLPGAGAAGGLGAAFAGILGGRMRRGIDIVLDAVGFADRVEGASLVITGEGRIDAQTIMGKTPAGVLEAAAKKGIPVMAIGGSVEAGTQLPGFVSIVQATPPGMTLSEAMKSDVARRNIEEAAFRAIKEYYKL